MDYNYERTPADPVFKRNNTDYNYFQIETHLLPTVDDARKSLIAKLEEMRTAGWDTAVDCATGCAVKPKLEAFQGEYKYKLDVQRSKSYVSAFERGTNNKR